MFSSQIPIYSTPPTAGTRLVASTKHMQLRNKLNKKWWSTRFGWNEAQSYAVARSTRTGGLTGHRRRPRHCSAFALLTNSFS